MIGLGKMNYYVMKGKKKMKKMKKRKMKKENLRENVFALGIILESEDSDILSHPDFFQDSKRLRSKDGGNGMTKVPL